MNPWAALAVVVTGVAAAVWLLFKTPPFLALAHAAGGAADVEERRLEDYARWFAHMRWVAVLLALVLVVTTVGRFLPSHVLAPLAATVALVAGTNLVYHVFGRGAVATKTLLVAQLYADLGLLVVLLHLSESCNPEVTARPWGGVRPLRPF